jgi:hypothetical protein
VKFRLYFGLLIGIVLLFQKVDAQQTFDYAIPKGEQRSTIAISSTDYDFGNWSLKSVVALNTHSVECLVDGEWISTPFYSGEHVTSPTEMGEIPPHSDSIRWRFKSTLPNTIQARLYFAKTASYKSLQLTVGDSLCDCPQPTYCAKDCWCPDNACINENDITYTTPTHVILHHTAGYNQSDDFAGVVRYYWDFHVNTNGWDDIGYNWLIDANGVIYEGRGVDVQGAHFSCMNGATTGIAMIGSYGSQLPTNAAIEALESLLKWEACRNNIDYGELSWHHSSELDLYGLSSHRDGNTAVVGCPKGTACPGDALYGELATIRSDVAADSCVYINDVEVVENDAFENGDVRWFNLQGQEVDVESAPHGVYVGVSQTGRRKIIVY